MRYQQNITLQGGLVMKRDKQSSSFVNIGSSSLLIIFLILCLATFAILSLSSAKSDYTSGQKLAQHKKEYYEASAKAETILAKIDQALAEADNTQESNIPTEVDDISINREGKEVSYEIPMSEKQALHVTLCLNDPKEHETFYEITAWQVISTNTWEGNQSIELMPMNP